MSVHALHTAFRDHAIPFRSRPIDPDDFSDLEGLRPVIERRRLVLLGEHSHGDGAAFAVKTRLVRFLHRELGFDVIAFETGIFDGRAAWHSVKSVTGDPVGAKSVLRRALPDLWSRCVQVAPLIDEIAREHGPRPLELVGFDCQMEGLAEERLADDMGSFLVGSGLCTSHEWQAVRPVATALANRDSRQTAWPDDVARARFLALLREWACAVASASRQDPSSRVWGRVLGSIRAQAVNLWSPDQRTSGWRNPYMRRREAEMARNLCWWAGEQYPTRRIAVWAHQGHLLRNQRDVPAWTDWHVDSHTAGEAVWDSLPGEVYTIGFAACSGSFGRVGQPSPARVRPPSEEAIEGAMWRAGYDAALIDFTNVPDDATALRRCACRLKGYREVVVEPQRHLDGLIILRAMEPAWEIADEGAER